MDKNCKNEIYYSEENPDPEILIFVAFKIYHDYQNGSKDIIDFMEYKFTKKTIF